MSRIRIKDIARIANVSIGTVDRVIHDRGEVSEATRERVRRILKEYDYTPDLNASSLALKRRVHLGVLMPDAVNDHAFWTLPRSGVERALAELAGYRVTVEYHLFDQFDAADFNRKASAMALDRVEGVLFAPVFQEESQNFLERCRAEDRPVVLFNSLLEGAPFTSFVGQDAIRSGSVAARLIHYGMEKRRDVAIVNMSARRDHYAHIIGRERGFRSYFEEHGSRIDRLVTLDLNGAGNRELIDGLERTFSTYGIGGIFVTNSRVYKVAEYLASRGLMNVRLVGYDLLPESVEFLKRDYIDFLISQRPEEQAYLGLNSLFRMVAFRRNPEELQFLPIDIITRENLVHYPFKNQLNP